MKRTKPLETEAMIQRSKYHAKPTVVDNVRFASKREALYYMQLKALLKAGRIKDLELQPRYRIPPDGWERINGTEAGGCICTYVADFRYQSKDGYVKVVDVKGMKTPVYKLKRKLMAYFYPNVEVIEA